MPPFALKSISSFVGSPVAPPGITAAGARLRKATPSSVERHQRMLDVYGEVAAG
jgi:hypothetical protein